MKAFKITIPDRSVRRAVMAGSFEELVEKAKEKLCVHVDDDISIVLEEDGTVIDDWEIAQAFSEKPFMILAVARKWPSDNSAVFEECILRITDAESASTSHTAIDRTTYDHSPLYFPSRVSESLPTLGDFISQHETITPVGVPPKMRVHLPGCLVLTSVTNMILPTLSPYVSRKMDDGRPFDVWAKFVEEMAYGLLSTRVMATRSDYEEVGQAVFRKYPCISIISKNPTRPWNAFVKSLSQKIRHIRWTEKKRTLNPNPQSDKLPTSPKSHSLAKRPCLQVDFEGDAQGFSIDTVKLEKILPHCDD